MPIYEYRCDSCSHEFEKFLRAGDEEPSMCPECSESALSRLISNTSFKLEGSGWYETDYARDDDPENGEAPESEESGGEATADSEAEGGAEEGDPCHSGSGV
jgi:putative FmdB family regulatory protein